MQILFGSLPSPLGPHLICMHAQADIGPFA